MLDTSYHLYPPLPEGRKGLAENCQLSLYCHAALTGALTPQQQQQQQQRQRRLPLPPAPSLQQYAVPGEVAQLVQDARAVVPDARVLVLVGDVLPDATHTGRRLLSQVKVDVHVLHEGGGGISGWVGGWEGGMQRGMGSRFESRGRVCVREWGGKHCREHNSSCQPGCGPTS
jgi:hypothetical protein